MKRFMKFVLVVWSIALLSGLPALAGQDPASGGPMSGFPDLVAALKATRGCLGVETARTASGKMVIFAWFEDKAALLRWYHSEPHRQAMAALGPSLAPRTPLEHVRDDSGPILAIASLTPPAPDAPATGPVPFRQIAIELYQPLAGGIAAGGRFAPDALKVPGLIEILPRGPR